MGLGGQESDRQVAKQLKINDAEHDLAGFGLQKGVNHLFGFAAALAHQILDAGDQGTVAVPLNGPGRGNPDLINRIGQSLGQHIGALGQGHHAQGFIGGKADIGIGRLLMQQLAHRAHGADIADIAEHVEGMDQQVNVTAAQIADQHGNGLGADPGQPAFHMISDIGVRRTELLIEFLQGQAVFQTGEGIDDDDIKIAVRAHAFNQALHRCWGIDIRQGVDGRDNQLPVAGIEKITQGVDRRRIADIAQGNETGLHQPQVLPGGGKDLFQHRDRLFKLNFAGQLNKNLFLPELRIAQQLQQLPGILHHPAEEETADNRLGYGILFFTVQQSGQQNCDDLAL